MLTRVAHPTSVGGPRPPARCPSPRVPVDFITCVTRWIPHSPLPTPMDRHGSVTAQTAVMAMSQKGWRPRLPLGNVAGTSAETASPLLPDSASASRVSHHNPKLRCSGKTAPRSDTRCSLGTQVTWASFCHSRDGFQLQEARLSVRLRVTFHSFPKLAQQRDLQWQRKPPPQHS